MCLSVCKISHGQVDKLYINCQKAVIRGTSTIGSFWGVSKFKGCILNYQTNDLKFFVNLILLNKSTSPGLNKGVTFATFKSLGTIPVIRDKNRTYCM